MERALHVDAAKCTGCLQCELACSFAKEGSFNPSRSRIKVFHIHESGRFVPFTCTQCGDAWCMAVCPVEAIRIDRATGARVVEDNLCVGCKVCTLACPFGTINYVPANGNVVKCDLCGGKPACASSCPTGAITYVDANWTGYDRMRTWAARTAADTVAGE